MQTNTDKKNPIDSFKADLENEKTRQSAIKHYEQLRNTATYSAFQEFEKLTPIFIDFKLTEAVKKTTKNSARPDLNAKALFNVDNISMNKALNSLSAAIYNTSLKSQKTVSSVFHNLKKKEEKYKKLKGALGEVITIDSQMKNIKDIMIQSALAAQKNKVINNMKSLELVNDKNAPIKSAHTVLKYQSKDNPNQLFFAKGKDTSLIFSKFYNHNVGGLDEHIREYFGSEFMKAMDINAPTITLKVDEKGQFEKMVSEGVANGEELGKKIGAPNGMKSMHMSLFGGKAAIDNVTNQAKTLFDKNPGLKDKNPGLKDKIMELHAISLLMGNIDLHVNNIMIVEDPKTKELSPVPIDFGLSGMTMDARKTNRYDPNTLRHADFNTLFTDAEYAEVLKNVVKKLTKPESELTTKSKYETIKDDLFYKCSALGATNAQLAQLSKNLECNLKLANKFVDKHCPKLAPSQESSVVESASITGKEGSVVESASVPSQESSVVESASITGKEGSWVDKSDAIPRSIEGWGAEVKAKCNDPMATSQSNRGRS